MVVRVKRGYYQWFEGYSSEREYTLPMAEINGFIEWFNRPVKDLK
ncbi:hypothetical protein [Sporomusa aerivorans]